MSFAISSVTSIISSLFFQTSCFALNWCFYYSVQWLVKFVNFHFKEIFNMYCELLYIAAQYVGNTSVNLQSSSRCHASNTAVCCFISFSIEHKHLLKQKVIVWSFVRIIICLLLICISILVHAFKKPPCPQDLQNYIAGGFISCTH